jgi:very-short-patch-repair endonuclease
MEQVGFARGLRQRQTDAEKALWMKLRNKQLEGVLESIKEALS